MSQRSLQNSPLESSCVFFAFIENYTTLKSLKISPEKSQILSCDTVVANERYETCHHKNLRIDKDETKLFLQYTSHGSTSSQNSVLLCYVAYSL
jgi:hypothetical protein